MEKSQKRNVKNIVGTIVKEGYEASVAVRALDRAGQCPQLKGHVHELMFCDKYNLDPVNLLKGNHAQLTKSNIAKMKDVIATDRNGRVIIHAQLKDTASASGAAKTAKQILSEHYNKTKILGTKETVDKVAKKIADKTAQKISDSGISSETTRRVADKALGKIPTPTALGSAAKAGAMAGAVVGAGTEAISSIGDVIDGKKDVDDAIIDIAGAGIKGGITGAASAAAGSAAAGAAGMAIASATGTAVGGALAATTVGTAAVAVAPVAVGFAAACAVGSVISWFFD